ncbi:splicing factor ESS-2 homolog [Babylonia areolata]|uniref:splicing factor ESS-2 homolog n=1 Tax=Babylonia areolata TaxID=304850 RepID=UPI003FD0D992
MAVEKRKENIVAVQCENETPTKKRKIILDEDAYTERIEKIIERDFFPDLSNLSVQKTYFDAVEKNDLVKLRELQMKYGGQCPTTGRLSSVYDSPAFFETPQTGHGQPSSAKSVPSTSHGPDPEGEGPDKPETQPADSDKPDGSKETSDKEVGLDGFLAKHTSEDNVSFAEILEESERKRKEKHAWLFEKEGIQDQEHEKKLALPSIEEQAAITDRPLNVDTWTYKPDNTVMYVPEGVEYTAQELIEMRKHKTRQVVHQNTRFTQNPFGRTGGKELLQKAAVHKALVNQGKIGHDGRELLAAHTPQVNGFKLMGTPSPAPGVEESPLMTWGEIEGTPMRLEGTETMPMHTPGPVFKIPELPKRDRLGLALAEKVGKAHRAKKEAALKQVTRRLASPSPSMSPLERLNSMSPAAQRLASKRLGVKTHTDSALRASYSPSPSRTPGDKTPVHLSTPSPGSARSRSSSLASGPSPVRQSPRAVRPKPSITDNLLKLPRRQNASDFF